MKLKLILLYFCMVTPCFATVEILNDQMLVGEWSCSSSFALEKLQVVELSNASLNKDGTSLQKGTAYYKDNAEEATLKYDITSDWSMIDNKLQFKNLKVNEYSIDNRAFDQKHNISTSLLNSKDKINVYTILKLNENELIISPDGYNFKEVCRKK